MKIYRTNDVIRRHKHTLYSLVIHKTSETWFAYQSQRRVLELFVSLSLYVSLLSSSIFFWFYFMTSLTFSPSFFTHIHTLTGQKSCKGIREIERKSRVLIHSLSLYESDFDRQTWRRPVSVLVLSFRSLHVLPLSSYSYYNYPRTICVSYECSMLLCVYVVCVCSQNGKKFYLQQLTSFAICEHLYVCVCLYAIECIRIDFDKIESKREREEMLHYNFFP